jgi:hypothetical protein
MTPGAAAHNIAVLFAICFLVWWTNDVWWALLLFLIVTPTQSDKKED